MKYFIGFNTLDELVNADRLIKANALTPEPSEEFGGFTDMDESEFTDCPLCQNPIDECVCPKLELKQSHVPEDPPVQESLTVETVEVQGRWCPNCKKFNRTDKYPLGSTDGEWCQTSGCGWEMHSVVIMEKVPV